MARRSGESWFYSHLDHDYAATAYKAQGATVGRTYVLATPLFDKHATYVALSQHREVATVSMDKKIFSRAGVGTLLKRPSRPRWREPG